MSGKVPILRLSSLLPLLYTTKEASWTAEVYDQGSVARMHVHVDCRLPRTFDVRGQGSSWVENALGILAILNDDWATAYYWAVT